MVSLIKNSTNYGVFILESEGVNNDDWFTDHAHIKEADWDLYTEGTEGIFLPFAGKISHKPIFKFDIIDFFEGDGADVSLGTGHDMIAINGRFGGANEAERNLKMANMMLLYWKHLKTSDEQLYLGYRKIGEIWHPFIDSTPAIVYYMKGKLIDAFFDRADNQLFYNWKVVFRGL